MRAHGTVAWTAVALAAGLWACPGPRPSDGEDKDAGLLPASPDAGPGADGGAADAGNSDGGVADAGNSDGGAADAGPQLIGWANLQWPPWLTLEEGGEAEVYGQVWMDPHTSVQGATSGLEAEAGVGPTGTLPWQGGWSFTAARFNLDVGNNDEWVATLKANAPGLFDYAFRYRYQGGPWLYAGRDGTLQGYHPQSAGRLAVRGGGGRLKLATFNLHCLNDDPASRLDAAAARLSSLGVDVVALQEVCIDPAPGAAVENSAAYLARRLSTPGRTFGHLWAQTHLANGVTPEGVGLVFALPLAHAEVLDLPVGDFPRRSQLAVLSTPLGMAAFSTAHLSFRQQDAQARLEQARALVAAMDALQPTVALAVVAGDFNAIPGQPPWAELTSAGFVDAWAAMHPAAPGFTHRSDSPTRRIDYLFFRPSFPAAAAPFAVSLQLDQPYAAGRWASDHLAVFGELQVP